MVQGHLLAGAGHPVAQGLGDARMVPSSSEVPQIHHFGEPWAAVQAVQARPRGHGGLSAMW
eukprot:5963203-Pyramimonas_sp.AAC.1